MTSPGESRRIVIAGATSLRGKELVEALEQSNARRRRRISATGRGIVAER